MDLSTLEAGVRVSDRDGGFDSSEEREEEGGEGKGEEELKNVPFLNPKKRKFGLLSILLFFLP